MPSSPRSFPLFAFAAVVVALSGCILFVNDDASKLGTTTCEFQGSDTACGKCIATTCAMELDGCCTDSSCKGQLGWLDTCAAQSDEVSCQELTVFAPALAACVQGRCSACAGSDGGAGGAGGGVQTSCYVSTGSCECTAGAGTGNGDACTQAMVAPGLCCADNGWPSATTTCFCSVDQSGCGTGTVDVASCSN